MLPWCERLVTHALLMGSQIKTRSTGVAVE
jgi:hypothetical protein